MVSNFHCSFSLSFLFSGFALVLAQYYQQQSNVLLDFPNILNKNNRFYGPPPFRRPFGQLANRRIISEEKKVIEKQLDDDEISDSDDDDELNTNLIINIGSNNNRNINPNNRHDNRDGLDNQNSNGVICNENENRCFKNYNHRNQEDRHNNENKIKQCRTRNGNYPGHCLPKGQCYYLFGDLRYMAQESCQTFIRGHQVDGVCCPLDINFTPNRWESVPYRLTVPRWPKEPLRINRGLLHQAIRQADSDVAQYFVMEKLFTGQLGQVQVAFTPAHFLQMMFGPVDQNQQLLNLWGFRALQVTRALGERLNLTPKQMRDGLSQISLHGTPYEQYCLQQPECDARYKYRTIDGSCNNLLNPLWGRSLTQFHRLLPPEYSDGISELRISITGRALPLPRIISTKILETSGGNNAKFANRWNVMFMQWGQFLDHDITLGSSTRASNGQGLLCCNRTNAQGPLIHPACRPIYLPMDDPFYSQFNRQCNNFVRNAVGTKNSCNLGYREQTNVVTSFIDASMIYGSDFNRSRLIRSFRGGLLKIDQINGREWLPFDTMNNSLACSIQQQSRQRCVFAGDVRVNQQFGIVTLQLLFLREHNRLARILAELNPHWDDETIYQEARRIVSGEIQHITYNEYLPEALGRNVMLHYQISLQPTGHCLGYDPKINPSILNEFASAAYRWHTLVQKYYHMRNANGQDIQRYEMHRIFNNPTSIYVQGALDQAIRGMLAHRSERFDRVFTEDIKNLLFAQRNQRFGLDLMSINIQRGRDHGLPTYNQIRRLCGLEPIKNFRQMQSILLSRDDWLRLSRVYSHVDDIDFWVGGNLERRMQEGLLGPTFSCIVGEQFRRLKYGDRFWYENGGMAHSFSNRQLSELRKVTLAGIICQNSDDIRRIQPLAMLTLSEQNQLDCSLIPQMSLSPWRMNGVNRGYGSSVSSSLKANRNPNRRNGQMRRQQQRRGYPGRGSSQFDRNVGLLHAFFRYKKNE